MHNFRRWIAGEIDGDPYSDDRELLRFFGELGRAKYEFVDMERRWRGDPIGGFREILHNATEALAKAQPDWKKTALVRIPLRAAADIFVKPRRARHIVGLGYVLNGGDLFWGVSPESLLNPLFDNPVPFRFDVGFRVQRIALASPKVEIGHYARLSLTFPTPLGWIEPAVAPVYDQFVGDGTIVHRFALRQSLSFVVLQRLRLEFSWDRFLAAHRPDGAIAERTQDAVDAEHRFNGVIGFQWLW